MDTIPATIASPAEVFHGDVMGCLKRDGIAKLMLK